MCRWGGGGLIKTSAGGSLDITAMGQWEDRNTEPLDQWEEGRGLCTHMTGSVCIVQAVGIRYKDGPREASVYIRKGTVDYWLPG